ncbi:MAG: RNA polymerase sigma factor [Verrucomicrobiales bacterium]
MDADLSDAVFLREFATSCNQAAFRELVMRHQNMVFSAARRRLGRDDLAADVAQNVFIALARKAAWLSGRSSVGGWLYKATLMEAIRRQRDDARRMNRERDYAEAMKKHFSETDALDSSQVADLLPVLDDAMARLPDDDREALVLRFFRGLSLRETGNTLGTTEEAARKRVSRALEKLERLFRRRGMALPAAVLASTVLPRAVEAAPASLAMSLGAAAANAHAPGVAASLYLKALALSKVQALALCMVGAAVPMTWQWTEIRALSAANRELSTQLAAIAAGAPARPAPLAASVQPRDPGTTARNSMVAGSREGKERRTDARREGFWEHHALQRQRDRERRLATLRAEIGLDEAQLAAVTQAIETAETHRLALWQAAHHEGRKPPREEDAAISKTREEAIIAVMSDEQKAAYAEFLDEDARNKQEIYANDMLSAIQRILHLTDEQKDQVFSMFAGTAAEAGRQRGPRQDAHLDEAQVEQLKSILTEDQIRIWQRDRELSAQAFPARGQVPSEGSKPAGDSPPPR